jgi:LAGLIDADG DNA endonuclease family protein
MIKYTINNTFFKQINTPEKAYFLGWIVSDGSISKKNCLNIRLQQQDFKILETLKSFINYNRPLKIISYKHTIHKTWKDQVDLSIYNKEMCNDLRKLGYNNKKSYNAKFPTFLCKYLLPHFIRGIFEGDGCLSIKHKKSYANINGYYPTKIAQFHISGTKNICLGLKSVFNNIKIFSKIRKGTGCYNVRVSGNENICKLLNWIYKDSNNMKLDRKYNLFQELQIIENRDKSKDMDCRKVPIKQLDLNNNIIKIWPSATDAVKAFGKSNTGTLTAVCSKRKWFKTYLGFKWEYVN